MEQGESTATKDRNIELIAITYHYGTCEGLKDCVRIIGSDGRFLSDALYSVFNGQISGRSCMKQFLVRKGYRQIELWSRHTAAFTVR